MSNCEQYEIRPRVGTEKISTLKSALKSNTPIADATDLELIRLIQKASVAYALAWSMPRLSVQLYPDGVLQHISPAITSTQGKLPSKKSETEAARQAFMQDASQAFAEIEKLLAPPPSIDDTIKVIPSQMFGDKYMST